MLILLLTQINWNKFVWSRDFFILSKNSRLDHRIKVKIKFASIIAGSFTVSFVIEREAIAFWEYAWTLLR